MRNCLQYISDLHLDRNLKGKVRKIRAECPNLLICGDVGSPLHYNFQLFFSNIKKEFDNVFFVPGNHEYNTSSAYVQNNYIKHKPYLLEIINKYNIKLLDCQSYNLSKNVIIAGATLWSQPFGKRYYQTKEDFNLHIQKHNSEVEWITNLINNTSNKQIIMATHFAPSPQLIEKKYCERYTDYERSWFCTNLEHLIKPPIIGWFCGHSHSVLEVDINNVKCGINVSENMPKLFYY